MTGTTDFVPYATQAGALVESQAGYVADPQTSLGQQDGIADPANANKAWRQGTFIAAAIANFEADVLDENIPDDGNLANAIAFFEAAIKSYTGQFSKQFLTANLNVYVATSGNDTTGNGTSGAPWATLQHAYDYVSQYYDFSGFSVTVNVANGSYSAGAVITTSAVGGGINFVGNPGSPSSVVISASNSNCFQSGGNNSSGTAITVNGFTVTATGLAANDVGYGLVSGLGGPIGFQNVIFSTCSSGHIWAAGTGLVYGLGPYEISGGAPQHLLATPSGANIQIAGQVITLVGTPAFSLAFAFATDCAVIGLASNTFVGSATGPRYLVTINGAISTAGAGATYLPGNSAGTSNTGGEYT